MFATAGDLTNRQMRVLLSPRGMLSDRCPVCLVCPVCLSAMLVYCGQTIRWIKMPLGMEVGLGPGHTVRWAPISPKKGHSSPHFRPMSKIVAKRLDGSRCHLVRR